MVKLLKLTNPFLSLLVFLLFMLLSLTVIFPVHNWATKLTVLKIVEVHTTKLL